MLLTAVITAVLLQVSLAALATVAAPSGTWVNVTGKVSVTRGGFIYNRGTHLWYQTVGIKNVSNSVISGPIELVLTSLTTGVTLSNDTGVFSGDPYITAQSSELSVGSSVSVHLQFSDPEFNRINYVAQVYSVVPGGLQSGSPWPMFHANLQHTGLSPYTGSQNGVLKWKYQTGWGIPSSPAIGADGTVYVGSGDHNLYAINPDGILKWKYLTGRGVWSAPAIGADGTVYVGSDDGNLYAINPDGTLKWKYLTGGGVFSSPAIGADGTVYVGSYDHSLYAVNPDGTLKWAYQTGNIVDSSPAIGADGTVYVGSLDGNLYALK